MFIVLLFGPKDVIILNMDDNIVKSLTFAVEYVKCYFSSAVINFFLILLLNDGWSRCFFFIFTLKYYML